MTKKRLGIERASILKELGFLEPPDTLEKMSTEAWEAMLEEAQRQHDNCLKRKEST